jgi:hypothetical protein
VRPVRSSSAWGLSMIGDIPRDGFLAALWLNGDVQTACDPTLDIRADRILDQIVDHSVEQGTVSADHCRRQLRLNVQVHRTSFDRRGVETLASHRREIHPGD